jgi:hypothetical protein
MLNIELGTAVLAFVWRIGRLTVEDSCQQPKHCYRVKEYRGQ